PASLPKVTSFVLVTKTKQFRFGNAPVRLAARSPMENPEPTPPRLFGTAGIRGLTNVGITAELTLRVARAYGDWIHRHARGSGSVGHDPRWGAEMLARAAASGFASAGLHVQFYGCVSTGVLSLNVARTRQDGALLVTGSHLPPDRIGLLLLQADGSIAPFSV